MAQIIMYWKNDGRAAEYPTLPENMDIKSFEEVSDAKEHWLRIVSYMDDNAPALIANNPNFFKEAMEDMPNFKKSGCFFLFVNGEPAATITVIFNKESRSGYIHMVSCDPRYRGLGIGHILNRIAEYELKRQGMETAYLTTDDFRIPAIKSYLAAGYTPDLTSEEDFAERWEKIFEIINSKSKK